MIRLLLIRHAQNEWVRMGRLAGWTPGVHLNEEGRQQAEALGERLASANLRAVYSSPLERAVETAEAIIHHYPGLQIQIEDGIGEVHFGEWGGQRLRKLARKRLWKVVQRFPSRAQFPQGETIRAVQFRAVEALERIAAKHPGGSVAVISHADVIKTVLAHYAGAHLDMYQRFVVSPASISIIVLGHMGPVLVRVNDTSHCETGNERTKR